jgi:transposase
VASKPRRELEIGADPGGGTDYGKCIGRHGDAKIFKNGRQLAAWLGLVPRQDSSGGKDRLFGMSKRGDVYLRTLLIHGTRSLLRHLARRSDATRGWIEQLVARRNPNIAAVALANKNARIVWALLAKDRHYRADYRTMAWSR